MTIHYMSRHRPRKFPAFSVGVCYHRGVMGGSDELSKHRRYAWQPEPLPLVAPAVPSVPRLPSGHPGHPGHRRAREDVSDAGLPGSHVLVIDISGNPDGNPDEPDSDD